MIVPLNEIKSVEEFVLLGTNHVFVSEHATGQDASRALADYVRHTGREAYIYRRTDKGWVRH